MSPDNTEVPQTDSASEPAGASDVRFRAPVAADGRRMWEIARDSGVLDLNSTYAYVLWGREFSESSVVVESEGRVVGYITGFLRPEEQDGKGSVFVWQVGVDADQRGKGLAKRMLHHLMDRVAERGVHRLRTTITPDNEASQKTFGAMARERGMSFDREEYLTAESLGEGHEPEDLYTVS